MAELNNAKAEETEDPFSPHNLAIQQFITSARIYDCLMTMIRLDAPDVARHLLELHKAGHLVATAPGFSGTFLTDMMNGEEDEQSANTRDDND